MPLVETMNAKGHVAQAQFVSDREAAFWVRARRNRKLAEWTCSLTDEDNQAYLRLLLDEDFARRTNEGILLLKIKNDLAGFGVFLSLAQIEDMCARFEQDSWLEYTEQNAGR